jgi:hypothetical protein
LLRGSTLIRTDSALRQPLWPAALFTDVKAAPYGTWLISNSLGARYDFRVANQSLSHDIVRSDYCTNPITLDATDAETDAVGMNVTVTPSSPNNSSYLHFVTLCLRDLDQNNVYTAPINFSLGRAQANWSRGDAGNRLEAVDGFRPLSESDDIGDWPLAKTAPELALTFRNTLVWCTYSVPSIAPKAHRAQVSRRDATIWQHHSSRASR